jgi:molecular chaperone GrpE
VAPAAAGAAPAAAGEGDGGAAASGDGVDAVWHPDPDAILAAERLEDLQRLQAEYVNYKRASTATGR